MCAAGGEMLRGSNLAKYGWARKPLENVACAALHPVSVACTGKPAPNWDMTTSFSFLMEYACLLLMALYWKAVELWYRNRLA